MPVSEACSELAAVQNACGMIVATQDTVELATTCKRFAKADHECVKALTDLSERVQSLTAKQSSMIFEKPITQTWEALTELCPLSFVDQMHNASITELTERLTSDKMMKEYPAKYVEFKAALDAAVAYPEAVKAHAENQKTTLRILAAMSALRCLSVDDKTGAQQFEEKKLAPRKLSMPPSQ